LADADSVTNAEILNHTLNKQPLCILYQRWI